MVKKAPENAVIEVSRPRAQEFCRHPLMMTFCPFNAVTCTFNGVTTVYKGGPVALAIQQWPRLRLASQPVAARVPCKAHKIIVG